jgi:hypothetical protein
MQLPDVLSGNALLLWRRKSHLMTAARDRLTGLHGRGIAVHARFGGGS